MKIANDPVKSRFAKLRMLCRSLAGNAVYYLTITAPAVNDEAQRKKGVVITARVHPGETPSSWIMKGIIDFLTGESNQARVRTAFTLSTFFFSEIKHEWGCSRSLSHSLSLSLSLSLSIYLSILLLSQQLFFSFLFYHTISFFFDLAIRLRSFRVPFFSNQRLKNYSKVHFTLTIIKIYDFDHHIQIRHYF
jgi:hypothetical protein